MEHVQMLKSINHILVKKNKIVEFSQLLKTNDLNGIKFFLIKNGTTLVKFRVYIKELIPDILVMAVEQNCSPTIIQYIIEEGEYDDLNYEANFEENGFKGPLFTAIKNEFFNIADTLIKYGADINGEIHHTDILTYLNCIGCLTPAILTYILKNGYDLDSLDAFTINAIKSSQVQTLLTFATTLPSNPLFIRNDWYLEAIDRKNYGTLALFIQYDPQGPIEGLTRAIALLENYDQKHHTARKYDFLHQLRKQRYTVDIDPSLLAKLDDDHIQEKRNHIQRLLREKKEEEFQSYILQKKRPLKDYNTEHFDVLIYAIEHQISEATLQFIQKLGPYPNYHFAIPAKTFRKRNFNSKDHLSMNHSTSCPYYEEEKEEEEGKKGEGTQTKKTSEKTKKESPTLSLPNFKTPLTAALSHQRFDLADHILSSTVPKRSPRPSERKATAGKWHWNIFEYFYRNGQLNEDTVHYILGNPQHQESIALAIKTALSWTLSNVLRRRKNGRIPDDHDLEIDFSLPWWVIEEAIVYHDNSACKVLLQMFPEPIQKNWYRLALMNGNADILDYLTERDHQPTTQVLSNIQQIITEEDIGDDVFLKASSMKNKELSIKLRKIYLKKMFHSMMDNIDHQLSELEV